MTRASSWAAPRRRGSRSTRATTSRKWCVSPHFLNLTQPNRAHNKLTLQPTFATIITDPPGAGARAALRRRRPGLVQQRRETPRLGPPNPTRAPPEAGHGCVVARIMVWIGWVFGRPWGSHVCALTYSPAAGAGRGCGRRGAGLRGALQKRCRQLRIAGTIPHTYTHALHLHDTRTRRRRGPDAHHGLHAPRGLHRLRRPHRAHGAVRGVTCCYTQWDFRVDSV